MEVITVANIKGGVGKTTSTVNLAFLLATELNKRVLVIDADDQGNATKSLGVRGNYDRTSETLWSGLEKRKSYSEVMVDTHYDRLWVIPACKNLRSAQIKFGQTARALKLFRKLLNGADEHFDFVLIDTKPQVNILLQSALAASNWYLIPSFPESDSYDGFVDLVAECEEIYEEENSDLKCLGVLFTCLKNSPAHDTYMEFVKKHLKKVNVHVFPQTIKTSNAIASGTLQNKPAVSLASAWALREDYLRVAQHLVRKATRKDQDKKRPDLEGLGIWDPNQMRPNQQEALSLTKSYDDQSIDFDI